MRSLAYCFGGLLIPSRNCAEGMLGSGAGVWEIEPSEAVFDYGLCHQPPD